MGIKKSYHVRLWYIVFLFAGILLFLWLGYLWFFQDDLTVIGQESENVSSVESNLVVDADNLLTNPSFEQGSKGWEWLKWSKGWSAFELSSKFSKEGQYSLLLPVHSMSDGRRTIVWGGVQEPILASDIPDCLEGYFYIEDWQKGDWNQYLQVVIIDLEHSLGEGMGKAQLRYIVTGELEAPLEISNAQYLFEPRLLSDRPAVGQWQYFYFNPREDFRRLWGYIPKAGSKLRVLFEARFDSYDAHKGNAKANVYYDKLYFGLKKGEHCAQ